MEAVIPATPGRVTGDHVVFSIATNGYEIHFRNCLETQRDYCRRLGVPHVLVAGAPPWGISAGDSAWLKIPMMGHLLRHAAKGVLYLDADCEIMPGAPDFRSLGGTSADKSVFACHDFSNRINAAVIYARKTRSAVNAFRLLRWSAFLPVQCLPKEDRNLYENGHVIWFFKRRACFQLLPREWNHGIFDGKEGAYIFHHGGTAVRESGAAAPTKKTAWTQKVTEALVGFRLIPHMAYFKRHLMFTR